MPPFSFMACCPRVYSDPCFSTLLPWRSIFPYFMTPPLGILLLDALPLHSVFLHLHYFFVSYPYWAYFLLDLAFECLLHHASKCNPYPVQSLCIHWMHIVNPILLSVHDRTSNLGFYIFLKCDACTCPSCHVSFPHILANLLLFCLLRPVLLGNKVLNIFAGTLPYIWRALDGGVLDFFVCHTFLVNFVLPFLPCWIRV